MYYEWLLRDGEVCHAPSSCDVDHFEWNRSPTRYGVIFEVSSRHGRASMALLESPMYFKSVKNEHVMSKYRSDCLGSFSRSSIIWRYHSPHSGALLTFVLCDHHLLCIHRNYLDWYHISESMEHVHETSRKRTNPSNVPQSGDVRGGRNQDNYSSENCPKRQRPGPSLGEPNSHSNALSISTDSTSFVIPDSNFSSIQTHNDSNVDILQDEFSMFPPGTLLGFEQYPNVDDQLSLPQDVAIASNAAGTPATCTITNATFSPGPLNRQSLLDPNDCVNQSPDGGSEQLYAGSEDLNFGIGDEWQSNELNSSHLIIGNLCKSTFYVSCRTLADHF
jgi:hypothetical protein